jgi:hypothetical protein
MSFHVVKISTIDIVTLMGNTILKSAKHIVLGSCSTPITTTFYGNIVKLKVTIFLAFPYENSYLLNTIHG